MTAHQQGHLPAAPMSAQQQAERHQQQQAAFERAKLRARKPTDKTMPDGVEDCVVSDGVQRYRELRDFERRLDATITRKRLDVVDSVGRNTKVCDALVYKFLLVENLLQAMLFYCSCDSGMLTFG